MYVPILSQSAKSWSNLLSVACYEYFGVCDQAGWQRIITISLGRRRSPLRNGCVGLPPNYVAGTGSTQAYLGKYPNTFFTILALGGLLSLGSKARFMRYAEKAMIRVTC